MIFSLNIDFFLNQMHLLDIYQLQRQKPVLVSLATFKKYQQFDAQTVY